MKRFASLFAAAGLLGSFAGAHATPLETCNAAYAVKPSPTNYHATVADGSPVRQLLPSFFGFNLEWLEFQSALWDKQNARVNPDAVKLLSGFPGAVYRYPGGTNAQFFPWQEATGAQEKRPANKRATWGANTTIGFGPNEYLAFLQSVGGQAWYVANLYGSVGQEQDNTGMAKSAGDLADFLRQQKVAGAPAVLRWELGNELDRDSFQWPPQKLADASVAATKQIKQRDPDAQVVAMLEEYAAQQKAGFTASAYNKVIASAVRPLTSEFAMHLYYDGKPTPPLRQVLNELCQAVDNARSTGVNNPTVWITEHARVPDGAWSRPDWKDLYPQTADLQAAISVSDMLIASAGMPEVNGTMVHALHASSGPWPLMHKTGDGHVYPSTVLIAMRMLRDAMLPQVLATKNESANAATYNGGYDMRALVMTDAAHKNYALWAVNRSGGAIDTQLTVPGLKGKSMGGRLVAITDSDPKANNFSSPTRVQPTTSNVTLKFDDSGTAHVSLPPYAVATITFQ